MTLRLSGLEPLNIGKDTLFKGPWGRLFRHWGGIPVNRDAPGGLLENLAASFAATAPPAWLTASTARAFLPRQ